MGRSPRERRPARQDGSRGAQPGQGRKTTARGSAGGEARGNPSHDLQGGHHEEAETQEGKVGQPAGTPKAGSDRLARGRRP
jgi:hypothetical protein